MDLNLQRRQGGVKTDVMDPAYKAKAYYFTLRLVKVNLLGQILLKMASRPRFGSWSFEPSNSSLKPRRGRSTADQTNVCIYVMYTLNSGLGITVSVQEKRAGPL